MSSPFLEQSLEDPRLIQRSDPGGGQGDFLAQRPQIEEQEPAAKVGSKAAQPGRLLSDENPESDSLLAPQAAAAPRNWDSLTSRGFLGWRWLFNVGGARDKRRAEKKERRAAFADAWKRGGSSDFVDSTGILNSKYARDKLAVKRNDVARDMAWSAIDGDTSYQQQLAKYTQLSGIAEQSKAAAKRAKTAAKSSKKAKKAGGSGTSSSEGPQQRNSEAEQDQIWHSWAKSQPFGQSTPGPGPSALRHAPAKSGMKPSAPLMREQRPGMGFRHAAAEQQAQVEKDLAQAQEIRAHEAFLLGQRQDTTGALAGLDATMEGAHGGKVRITREAGHQNSDELSEPAETRVPAALSNYASAMRQSLKAEKTRATWATFRHAHDQGDLAMPLAAHGNGRGAAAAYFNGFWNQERANPSPTRAAGHDRHVRFDTGNAGNEEVMNRPAEHLDPEREGAGPRVLPTSVHRYLTSDGEGRETSDGDAYMQSLMQTRYNRHMASLGSDTDLEAQAEHADRFKGPVPYEFFAGTQSMRSNRESKTAAQPSVTRELAARSQADGAGLHRRMYGNPQALAAPLRAPDPEPNDEDRSRSSLYSLDQLVSQSQDDDE